MSRLQPRVAKMLQVHFRRLQPPTLGLLLMTSGFTHLPLGLTLDVDLQMKHISKEKDSYQLLIACTAAFFFPPHI